MADSDGTVELRRVHCRVEGPIGWLLIDNPGRMNAMSFGMWHDLGAGAARLGEDPAVRVVVLAGADCRNFCAGGDISEFSELRSGAAAMDEYDVVGKESTNRLKHLTKPTIAMISGYCLGGGMGLAASCDLRIAGHDAKLGIPAARRALSYDFDGLRLLVGLVGLSQAKRIMFTGSNFSAEESLRIGLVDEVVPTDRLRDHVVALAGGIANNAPLSVAASKFIIDMIAGDEDKYDRDACRAREAECLASADYVEATRSFMEKRPPLFTGR